MNEKGKKTMDLTSVEHFDMKKPPVRCRWYLKPIAWMLCVPGLLKHRPKVTKVNMKGLKPPYLLLGNHNAFFDMSVSASVTFPHFANYVVAIDGFIGREWLLRNIGCICKRKFTNDVRLIRHIQRVKQKKGILGLYPEARYSLCGTTAPLPRSLGQLCKMLDVPVVTVICHGHHINHPFWNTRHERGVRRTEAEVRQIFTREQLAEMSADEINDRLVEAFQYDDFKWQYENRIKVDCPDRAEGLEKILYQCPHCGTEFEMSSQGTTLTCNACGKSWEMTEYGRLEAREGETEYPHIPDWYEWERKNVRAEVEAGRYSSGELPVTVESLPNAKKFIKLGEGRMIHDGQGFRVTVENGGEPITMEKTVASMYSCHIEYEYLFKHGDCVDLNTTEDTWYVYPHDCKFSVTKMAIATEELYCREQEMLGRFIPAGLA